MMTLRKLMSFMPIQSIDVSLGMKESYLKKRGFSSIRELQVKKAHEGDLIGHFGDCKTVRPYMSIFIGLT
ncbi:hypothetical protein CR513_17050, partial [Mucuna pruriens]